MNKPGNLKALVLALGMTFVPSLAHAELTSGMSPDEVNREVHRQLTFGAEPIQVGREARRVHIGSAQVAEAMIKSQENPILVVKVLIALNPNDAAVITAAVVKMVPDQSKAIITAVLTIPGVNPADVLAATASGGESHEERHAENHHAPAGTPSGSGGGRHHASPA